MPPLNNNERSHERKDIDYHAVIASEYDRVVVEPRRLSIDALFRPLCGRLPANRKAMLDLGCGTGHMLCRYGAEFARVVAIDHSQEMLDVAKESARRCGMSRVQFDRADAFEFLRSRSSGEFDFVTCVGFLHHLEQPRIAEMLALIASVLAVNGLFVFAEPVETTRGEPRAITWWNAKFRANPRGYSQAAEDPDEAPLQVEQLRRDARNAGLTIITEGRGWEIFPRHEPPSRMDALAIPLLHRLFGAGGPVYWAACTRNRIQDSPNNSPA